MSAFLSEVQYAFRQIRKSPGFSLTVILTLAIGIGANTAMFTVMDAVILRPLAVPDLNRVVTMMEEASDKVAQPASMGDLQDWREQSKSYSEIAMHAETAVGLTGSGDPEHLQATRASINLFHLLAVEPWLGRTFLAGEDLLGREQEVTLTFPFWQKHFGGDREIVGRKLTLDGRTYQVVGVLPQGFHYQASSDVFLPLALTPEELADRNNHRFTVLARLRPGVTIGQAQAELQTIARHSASAHPQSDLGWSTRVEFLADQINGEYTPMYMRLMMGAGIFVLLIICANVSNLQFSRSIGRRSEIAIRTAMGAGRGRILRQLLMESVLLSLFGAAIGVLLARLELHLTLVSMPPRIARFIPGWSNIRLDARALGFSLALAILTGVVAGLAPTLSALRVGVADQLKAGGRSVTSDRKSHRLRSIFAIAQITLSVALVAGAALMSTGMQTMLRVADRFSPERLLVFKADLPVSRYATEAQQSAFYEESLRTVRNLPGVVSAETTQALPYNNTGTWWQDLEIQHTPVTPGEIRSTQRLTVSPTYLQQMKIPLIRGRQLQASDRASTTPVAVISQKLAERFFPNRDPLGQKIRLGKDAEQTSWITVVGVVGNVTLLWVDQAPQPAVYLSYTQFPTRDAWFAVRTTADPLATAPAVRHAVAGVDASLPLDRVQSYAAFLREGFTGLSYVAVMFGVDAAIALLLSAIGIFGVMANGVAERTHEIGVRMALGANPGQIRWMVLKRALMLTAAGLGTGMVLALGLARAMASLIFGVNAGDQVIFSLTAAGVALVALLATWIPAQRAAVVDPMMALRSE